MNKSYLCTWYLTQQMLNKSRLTGCPKKTPQQTNQKMGNNKETIKPIVCIRQLLLKTKAESKSVGFF